MGLMWQTLLLYRWKSLFGWLPIETLIRERQDEYYKVLGECDNSADSGKMTIPDKPNSSKQKYKKVKTNI